MIYRVRPCKIYDLPGVIADLRDDDRAELESLGISPRRALFSRWYNSAMSRIIEIGDGSVWSPAVVGGDAGPMLADQGEAWLFTTRAGARLPPLVLVRLMRAFVAERMAVRHRLISSVGADYPQSVRFLEMIGFRALPAEPLPPFGAMFHRVEIERA